ncbi:hypothetical protein [Flavisphingomonas formosensis]|nr:hypothetical protein [Sphingomonas formosensis]
MPSPSRWTRIVDWLGAQGAANLTLYSCSISAVIGTVAALLR